MRLVGGLDALDADAAEGREATVFLGDVTASAATAAFSERIPVVTDFSSADGRGGEKVFDEGCRPGFAAGATAGGGGTAGGMGTASGGLGFFEGEGVASAEKEGGSARVIFWERGSELKAKRKAPRDARIKKTGVARMEKVFLKNDWIFISGLMTKTGAGISRTGLSWAKGFFAEANQK